MTCRYDITGYYICTPTKETFTSFDDPHPNISNINNCTQYSTAFQNYLAKNNFNSCVVTSDVNSCQFNIQTCSDSKLCNNFSKSLASDPTLNKCSSSINPNNCSMNLSCS